MHVESGYIRTVPSLELVVCDPTGVSQACSGAISNSEGGKLVLRFNTTAVARVR